MAGETIRMGPHNIPAQHVVTVRATGRVGRKAAQMARQVYVSFWDDATERWTPPAVYDLAAVAIGEAASGPDAEAMGDGCA